MDLTKISEFDSTFNPAMLPDFMHIDLNSLVRELEETHRKIREQLPRGPIYSMRSELKRLKSVLAQDPLSSWSPKEIAHAGFFCTGLEKSCQCFCCGLVLCKQTFSFTPMDQHKKFNPDCEFVRGNDVGNISKYETRVQHNTYQRDHGEDMEDMQNRLQSFSAWPVYALLEPSALSQAGFFFTGTRDTVQCFSCAGCLGNWEENDDPWKEHAKWFPECSFLQSQKSKDETEQYIANYCGFAGLTVNGIYRTGVETTHRHSLLTEKVDTLKKQLIEKYTDSTFFNMSPFRGSLSIDLRSLFADISVVLKDTKNQPLRKLTLPDVLSLLGDITMIEGEAGSGKSALLRKIAILWATGNCPMLNRFTHVFYIALPSLESQQSLCDIICHQLIGSNAMLTEVSLGEIIKQLKDKVLFLLDDYGMMDSIPEAIEVLILKNPWNRLSLAVTVSTDKSWKLRQYAKTILSLQTFPLYSTIYLVKNIFSHDNDKIDTFLLQLVKPQNVPAILQTPLIILAQCSSWIENCDYKFEDVHIFKTYLKCIMLKFPHETEAVKSQLVSCGELALKGLFESKFQFSDDDLKASEVESDKAIKFGLLSKFTAQRLRSIYRFFEPSFQEFLAGKRLSELLESDKPDDLSKGFHYLHQVNTFLKLLGRYSYFLKYASRISTKATLKILSFLFTLYDNPEALDCDLDSREHLQRHPELQLIEENIILLLRNHNPVDAVSFLILATIAIEAAEESQSLPDCAPLIMEFMAGKTLGFSITIISNNSTESILSFIEKYPNCISLLSCITFVIDATGQVTPPDYTKLEKSLELLGVPTVESDYSSAYVSMSKMKEDNEKSKKDCDQYYSLFPEKIVIRDSIARPFMSIKGHKVPVFKLQLINVNGNNASQLNCENFKVLFSISDQIELQLDECRDFVSHIRPAIEQFSDSFRKLGICDSYLTADEQDLLLKMSSLECLEIGCNHGENYPVTVYLLENPDVLDHLPEEFNTLHKVKKLAFGCTGYSTGSAKFAGFIQRFADLEVLHLSFKYYSDFNGIMKSLSTCTKLKELSFFGSVLLEHDMAFLVLCKTVEGFTLHVHMHRSYIIGARLIKRLKAQNLVEDCERDKSTGERGAHWWSGLVPQKFNVFVFLLLLSAEGLKNFTSLKVLNLDRHIIFGADISEHFAIALGSLIHLEKLWLPVGRGMAHAAKLIIEQFQKLPNLKFLVMKEILDDDSIALLGTVAKKGCLRKLCHLALHSSYNVSESGWRTFFETAGDMPELSLLNAARINMTMKCHATTVTTFVRFVSRLPSLMTIWMLGWLLDKDDLNMFNSMKEKHPQSKSLEVIWQMPFPFAPNIQD
ncbi:PREDICTED: baculoviral IAP repeat-containing protein 1-like [Nanorana parkeri]|uniref:baculoviral IAP repeat-containing protein 1-like n=1 Tax=Nanorana parkeri TaxID=125878 RepID=UPI0008549D2D|nr:PREDICTED: baculoviral IAP repeat-containing protein 1-like [Nanorana parkeri]